jgi:hypothetical protein
VSIIVVAWSRREVLLMIETRRTDIVRYLKGSWHEANWSPGFSIHTVVTREASCGEKGGACTREGGRGQVICKKAEKKSGTPVEAKGTVNDTSRHGYCDVEVAAVVESSVGTSEGALAAWMITVLVLVEVRPVPSVAT